MIDWKQPCKPQEFTGGMRQLVYQADRDKMARLRLYRQMGYTWHRLKELGILTDELIDQVR